LEFLWSLDAGAWSFGAVFPGGRQHFWSEHWQTTESTVYGHPAQPKPGPGKICVANITSASLGLDLCSLGLLLFQSDRFRAVRQ